MSNSKSFFVKLISRSLISSSSGLVGSGFRFRHFLIAAMPALVSMFVYKLSISIVNRKSVSGSLSVLILSMKSYVSLR